MLAAVMAAGCHKPPSIAESIAKSKGEIEKRLAGVQGLVLPPPTTKLDLAGGKPIRVIKPAADETGNAALLFAEDLPDLSSLVPQPFRNSSPGASLIASCESIIQKQTLPTDPTVSSQSKLLPRHAAWYLPLCTKFDYVVIVKMGEIAGASANPDGETFTGGHADGYAYVYALPGPKLLGSVPFAAKSNSTVEVYKGQDAYARVDADLANQVMAAMRDAVKAAAPGSEL